MPRVPAFPAFSGALADDDLFVVIDVSETATQQDKTITALHTRRQLVRAAYVAATDPGVDDDESQGYVVGNFGLNTATGELFTLVDATTGAAVWVSNGSAAGAAWGSLTGDLQDQTDLADELSARPTATGFTEIVTLTQAAYDAIPVKDPATLYIITDD